MEVKGGKCLEQGSAGFWKGVWTAKGVGFSVELTKNRSLGRD
jgi:hypothetical protein